MIHRSGLAALLALTLLGVNAPSTAGLISPGSTVRVSVAASGDPDGPSGLIDLTPDGALVLFLSRATNLVPEDGDPGWDVFVRDIRSATTQLVADLDGSDFQHAAISADGRFVAMATDAPGVVLYDRATGSSRELVSGPASAVSVSGDGSVVAWAGYSSYLWSRESNTASMITLHDGTPFVAVDTEVSRDGRTVVIQTAGARIFAYDVATGAVEQVSEPDRFAHGPAVSADGRVVAYALEVEGGAADLVVYDRASGARTILAGSTIADASPDVTADGNNVSFASRGGPRALPGPGIYVWDVAADTVTRASVGYEGVPLLSLPYPWFFSSASAITDDGTRIAFDTDASATPDDGNGLSDVYLRDRRGGCTLACVFP